MKPVSFNGGNSGNNDVIVDGANIFGNRSLYKENFRIKSWARETNEVCCGKGPVDVTKS